MFHPGWVSILFSVLTALTAGGTPPGTPVSEWRKAGAADLVSIDADGTIRLQASQDITAGVVSRKLSVATECDAILVEALVTAAKADGVTFSIHDAASGGTIGYWQNPLPIDKSYSVSAVLPLSPSKASHIRLFVGTHGRASSARVAAVRWTPLRRHVNYRSVVWGALVDDGHRAGQTFRTQASKLAAIAVRVRDLNVNVRPAANAPLRVRLFEWKENATKTREQAPLAEAIVPRDQIPVADGSSERDLTVALPAATRPGAMYYVEFTTTGSCPAQEGLLLFGGEEGIADGSRYENENVVAYSDLYLETYDAATQD